MSRIVLVDDHPMVREGLRAVLQMAGHQVVGESSEGSHALQLLRSLGPDLAVLDLNLGGRDSGLHVLEALRAGDMATQVIVLTMSAQPRHVAQAVKLGAFGYLLKGSSSAELLRAIHAVSIGHRYYSEEIATIALQTERGSGPDDPLARLSRREREILELVVRGRSSALIAERLHLSSATVDTYRSRLMRKLDVPDLAALIRLAIRMELLDPDER